MTNTAKHPKGVFFGTIQHTHIEDGQLQKASIEFTQMYPYTKDTLTRQEQVAIIAEIAGRLSIWAYSNVSGKHPPDGEAFRNELLVYRSTRYEVEGHSFFFYIVEIPLAEEPEKNEPVEQAEASKENEPVNTKRPKTKKRAK